MKIRLCFTIIQLTNKSDQKHDNVETFCRRGNGIDKWDEVVFLIEVKEVDLKNKT